VIRGDIRDLPCLVDALRDVRPECVIHLAALVGEVNIPKPLYRIPGQPGGYR
jgi:nucleoside-diphosphate-sugar epimerase